MTRKLIGLALVLGTVLLIWQATSNLAEAQTSRERMEAGAQFTAGGAKQCLACHAGESMTLVAETAHGDKENPHTPFAQQGCESCHGAGSLHVSRSHGGAGLPLLLGFDGKTAIPAQTSACLDCHAEDMDELAGMQWAGSKHDTEDITCVSCHTVHTTENKMTDQDAQRKSCDGCHKKQIANHRKFETKGINFDALSCSACHDVHQLISDH